MLSPDTVAEIADPLFREALGGVGYQRVTVEAGSDHDDEPAFFLRVHYRPGEPALDPTVVAKGGIEAAYRLREALLARGEPRFPYVRHEYPGKPRAA